MALEIVKTNLNEYNELKHQLNELRLNYPFLYNINYEDEYTKEIEICDSEISNLKQQIIQLESEDINQEEKIKKLREIKSQYALLIKKSEVLYDAWDKYLKFKELEGIIVRSFSQPIAKKRNEDIHSLFAEAKNKEELEEYIDAVCIYMYKVPLLVALITKDPNDIERDFQISELPKEIKKNIIEIIEQKKIRIENNLLLSDKALIDLIEHTTGENIANQQRHNERVDTGYNQQFNGQVLIERGDEYGLLRNQRTWDRSTAGIPIKRFNKYSQFLRKDSDILIRNFPELSSEDLVYRSFKSLPNERKRDLITAVIYNLELCYDMFKSYYMSDKVEVPVMLNLTNGENMQFNYRFSSGNISHILGIPPTNKGVRVDDRRTEYTGEPELPQATLEILGIRNASALDVLKSILEHKDKIIENCGLIYDPISKSYYEMLPWERIILKTNAFIRGDFFKTTSLISGINPNSFLITPFDNIKRISLTPTMFSSSAINQQLFDPNMSFDELISIIKTQKSRQDFVFKGMSYDERNGIWFPKTNASAIGERISPNNSGTLKTLEKYRYLLSGSIPPEDGGFVASVESPISQDLSKEYSVQEMLTSLMEISNAFGTTAELENKLREYLEQVQTFSNHKKL